MGISFAVFSTMMLFGFRTFGSAAQALILNNYHRTDDPLASLARLATGCSILCGYPLMFAALKSSFFSAAAEISAKFGESGRTLAQRFLVDEGLRTSGWLVEYERMLSMSHKQLCGNLLRGVSGYVWVSTPWSSTAFFAKGWVSQHALAIPSFRFPVVPVRAEVVSPRTLPFSRVRDSDAPSVSSLFPFIVPSFLLANPSFLFARSSFPLAVPWSSFVLLLLSSARFVRLGFGFSTVSLLLLGRCFISMFPWCICCLVTPIQSKPQITF